MKKCDDSPFENQVKRYIEIETLNRLDYIRINNVDKRIYYYYNIMKGY